MSTHSEAVDCPNCQVSAVTGVAERLVNRDDDGVSNSICCRLCNHLSLTDESTDRYYEARQYSGDDIPIKDVPDRARAIMIEDGWTEADIEAEVESFVAVSSILEIGRTRGLAE